MLRIIMGFPSLQVQNTQCEGVKVQFEEKGDYTWGKQRVSAA